MALKFTADGVKKTQPCVTLKSTPWKLHSKCLIFDDCEQTQTERRKNEVIVVACSNQQCRLKDISIYICYNEHVIIAACYNEAIITPKSNVKKKKLGCCPRRYLINGKTSQFCRQKDVL